MPVTARVISHTVATMIANQTTIMSGPHNHIQGSAGAPPHVIPAARENGEHGHVR